MAISPYDGIKAGSRPANASGRRGLGERPSTSSSSQPRTGKSNFRSRPYADRASFRALPVKPLLIPPPGPIYGLAAASCICKFAASSSPHSLPPLPLKSVRVPDSKKCSLPFVPQCLCASVPIPYPLAPSPSSPRLPSPITPLFPPPPRVTMPAIGSPPSCTSIHPMPRNRASSQCHPVAPFPSSRF
jgi:hypothetical protein